MNRFIFFSKTNWDEVPRLRHQIARLLKDQGHEVVFFQKPNFVWDGKCDILSNEVVLKKTKQLVHHQLRVVNFLSKINEHVEINSISTALGDIDVRNNDVVLNFNYDYYFLRVVFPANKIITIINDDFVAQSKFFKGRHVKEAMSRTCRMSNATLTVSIPIKNYISAWCSPELFLPWADTQYIRPSSGEKDSLLVWATIGGIIDINLLDVLAKNYPLLKFSLIGPVMPAFKAKFEFLIANNSNITLSPPQSLEKTDLSAYFAAIMPYRSGNASTEAVTLANKSLRLMSKGLPLIVHGMPHFLRHSAIFKCNTVDDIFYSIQSSRNEFWSLQDDIKEFVDNNGAAHRYRQLMDIVGE